MEQVNSEDEHVQKIYNLIDTWYNVSIKHRTPRNENFFLIYETSSENPCLVLENYNCGRAKKGLLTTSTGTPLEKIEILKNQGWEYWGQSKTRFFYDTNGKSLSDIVKQLDTILNLNGIINYI